MQLSQTPEYNYSTTAKATVCTSIKQLKDTNIQRAANDHVSVVTFQTGIKVNSSPYLLNKLKGHPTPSKGEKSGSLFRCTIYARQCTDLSITLIHISNKHPDQSPSNCKITCNEKQCKFSCRFVSNLRNHLEQVHIGSSWTVKTNYLKQKKVLCLFFT